jgi:hypothetical protein
VPAQHLPEVQAAISFAGFAVPLRGRSRAVQALWVQINKHVSRYS